jgi:hypothetical protein
MQMSDKGPIFFMVWLFVLVSSIFFVIPRLDRNRIREHIETHGGKVIEISREWFAWGSGSARTYDVTYLTSKGERIAASCVTTMLRGVQWLSDRPPGNGMEAVAAGEEVEPSEEIEPIDCVQCGAKIPAGKTHCPHCGWSYKKTSNKE